MEFTDLFRPFTEKQKTDSFIYLQNYMLNKINEKEPFFIGRLSGNESNLCGRALSGMNIDQRLIFEMLAGAGIQFLSKEDLKDYVKAYHSACTKSDLLSIWSGTMYSQAKSYYDLLDKVKPTQKRICAQALEPFYFMDRSDYNFNAIFKGKKVLIVTSHEETTKEQLKSHTTIHRKPIFDETTQFHIYKPVQQNGGNHDEQSWKVHFEKMKNDLSELAVHFDFDIAIVSCGGFGMILCDHIYSHMRKSTIYVGGGLQLYFGIRGNRWNTHPVISKMMNEKWCSVVEKDKLSALSSNPRLCENSCYW